jgi:nuclear GTP-binding protein
MESASAILDQADAQQVVLKYTVPNYKNSLEFFTKHQKGGSPNVEGAAKLIWSEWTGASLNYYCHPPTSWTTPLHFNESVVANMERGFDLEELVKNNAHSMQAIRSPHLARSILFQSSGLTNGIIEEKDIPEELTRQRESKQEVGDDNSNMVGDQESVDGEVDEKVSDISPVEETTKALPEESTAGEPSVGSFILDELTKEDDIYDFSTDYM